MGDYEKAMELTGRYIARIENEKANAEEAIQITHSILSGIGERNAGMQRTYRRKEAADILGVTIDTLRNWELNGLFTVKRTENRYRVYTEEDDTWE